MSGNYFPKPYSEFQPLVREIQAGGGTGEYIGGGAESSVWRVALEGLNYAVKFTNPYSPRGRKRDVQRAVEGKVQTGLKGLGISGLEQLCTASPEDGVTIYRFIDGVVLSKATDNDISKITPQHFANLRKTVLLATQAGIEIDGWNDYGGNAIFSPSEGITLIDYWADTNITYAENLRYTVKSLGQAGLGLGTTFSDETI